MIDKNLRQIPIVEDQAREAIRRIRLNNGVLEEQLRMAEEFIQEEARRENKKIAYELAGHGIDRIASVDDAEDQVALSKILRELLTEAKEGSSGNEDDDIESFLDSMND